MKLLSFATKNRLLLHLPAHTIKVRHFVCSATTNLTLCVLTVASGRVPNAYGGRCWRIFSARCLDRMLVPVHLLEQGLTRRHIGLEFVYSLLTAKKVFL